MENKVTVSVIMGVYNPKDQQRFFAAVNSIIHQSFADWEFILYDDGSQIPYADSVRRAAKRETTSPEWTTTISPGPTD